MQHRFLKVRENNIMYLALKAAMKTALLRIPDASVYNKQKRKGGFSYGIGTDGVSRTDNHAAHKL